MIKRIALPAFAALALAGCGPTEPANTTVADNADVEANAVGNETETGNALAAVLGMSDRQRNVVFIRALMDAGIACQSVTESTRLPDQDGKPLWRATCSDKTAHMISITPEGTANIVSRTDR